MRRAWHSFVLLVLLGIALPRVSGEDSGVPISLQVELLDRLLWYERGFQRAAAHSVQLLIVARAGDINSERVAGQLAALLPSGRKLAGRKLITSRIHFESADQVAKSAVQRGAYLLYVTPGLTAMVPELARSLRGRPILTVSASGEDVARGVVLSFELASAKPRIAIHLPRAREQRLEFSAQLLRIAKVIQ